MPRFWRLLAVILVLIGVRPAMAQSPSGDSTDEVVLSCDWFGVGGAARPGEWAALRIGVKDSSDKQREVLIRVAIPDSDGDRALYERAMTTNPGVKQPLWLYVRLPARYAAGDLLTVEALAAVEQVGEAPAPSDARERFVYGAGRLLGSARLGPRSLMSIGDGMLGIVGTQYLGLHKYEGVPQMTAPFPTGHERTELVMGIDPEALPDRWFGLSQFDVIVWHQAPPGSLGADQANALREWVQRGGHLVVVLPRIGQTWTDEANNPLFDITPRVRVERHEGVSLEPLRALISTKAPKDLSMPTSELLQTFVPLDGVGPDEAIPILAAPGKQGASGGVIAVRRLVGTGMVTLVGLDAGSRWMQEHGAPDPQLFWHRILGRRGELWDPVQYQEAETASMRNTRFSMPIREAPTVLDMGIPSKINMTGFAARGVFLGFVVFVAYWLVAGPLGFALLKRTGLIRHAWVAFALAAGVFTALAWGGATAIRPGDLDAKHITLFEHVYGQNVQRARSFVSVHVPQYGEATLAVGDPALRATASSFHNGLAPFDTESTTTGNFPDARGYRIDSRNPDQITYPSRSTVKQFQVDWAGGAWKMPRPVKADGSPGDVHLEGDPDKGPATLRGLLVHDLPAPLEDVTIVVVLGEKSISVGDASPGNPAYLARVRANTLASPWAPGETIDLSTLVSLRASGQNVADGRAYFDSLSKGRLGDTRLGETTEVSDKTFMDRLMAETFFHQLRPPDLTGNTTNTFERLIQRKHTHGQDLSAFFTQPCVIIVGTLEGPCPVPLFASTGGQFRALTSGGKTLVRWVYPLAPQPPPFTASTQEPSSGGDTSEPSGDGGAG